MRKTIVTTVCDLPHPAGDTTNEPAHPFEVYSKGAGRFWIDLCEHHADRMIKPILANGRRKP